MPGCRRRSRSHSPKRKLKYNFGPQSRQEPADPNEFCYGPPRRRPPPWQRDASLLRRRRRERRRQRRRNRRRRGRRGSRGDSTDRSRSSSRDNSPEPKPQQQVQEVPKEEPARRLTIKDIDLHVEKNTEQHKTSEYDVTEEREGPDPNDPTKTVTLPPELILRRGDSFLITLQLDGKFDKIKNDLTITLSIGESPSPLKGTLVKLEVDESEQLKKVNPKQWHAQLVSMDGNSATVRIGIPANCIVGEWNLHVVTFSEGNKRFKYSHPEDIIILFNPWCPHDTVYMEEEDDRMEYVLNDSGCVFQGTEKIIAAKPWIFGQFEEDVLEAVMYLLRVACSMLPTAKRSDPIEISRKLTQLVNANDDNGVLVGNWSVDYSGGTSPLHWAGTPKILKQYYNNGNPEPVLYGQCWVFSAVLTTVCRCLGIPCRSVTNFSSAHDTDASTTIDNYWTSTSSGKLKIQEDLSSDSIWNFHVWNEAWMKRTDLSPEMDGWQVIDATPQEESEGKSVCGPSPLAAIKAGLCNKKYDTAFIFAEVNSDVVHWLMVSGSKMKVLRKDTYRVGKMISTRLPGKWGHQRLDLTNQYKFPEGSQEEREAVKRAWQTSGNRKQREGLFEEEAAKPVTLDIEFEPDVIIGNDMSIKVKINNPGDQERTVEQLDVIISPRANNAPSSKDFCSRMFPSIVVQRKGDAKVELTLESLKYLDDMNDMYMIEVKAVALLKPLPNTRRDFPVSASDTTRFRRPDIDVKCLGLGQLGKPVEFQLNLKNPLRTKALTNCCITADSSSGFKPMKPMKIPDIPPGGAITGLSLNVMPKKKKGKHDVVFSLECAELQDITGSTSASIK